MSTKNNPGRFDCYDKADPDEPMFVLLARDPDAPYLVAEWARRREIREQNEWARRREVHEHTEGLTFSTDKIAEARECAETMRQWETKTSGRSSLQAAYDLKVENKVSDMVERTIDKDVVKVAEQAHQSVIDKALHVRVDAMLSAVHTRFPTRLVSGARAIAKIIAHQAWKDGEAYGRKIHEGLLERCQEYREASEKALNDKRRMYEAPTTDEILAGAKLLMAKTNGKGFVRPSDSESRVSKALPTYYSMNVAAEFLAEFVKSRMREKPAESQPEKAIDAKTAENVDAAQAKEIVSEFYRGEPASIVGFQAPAIGVFWGGRERNIEFFQRELKFLVDYIPANKAVQEIRTVFGRVWTIDQIRRSTHMWPKFFDMIRGFRGDDSEE